MTEALLLKTIQLLELQFSTLHKNSTNWNGMLGPCALICCSVLFVVLFPAVVTVLSSTVMRKKVQKNLVDQDKIVKRFGACDC